jgi:hypothetical protein
MRPARTEEDPSMDSIALPMVESDVTLEQAFEVMKTAGRSGIVWRKRPTEFVLYQARNVVIGLAGAAQRLSNVVGESVAVPDIGTMARSSPTPSVALEDLGDSLAKTARLGVIAAGASHGSARALLFFRDSDLRPMLEPGPQDCYCRSCGTPGRKGSPCKVDGTIVTCRP